MDNLEIMRLQINEFLYQIELYVDRRHKEIVQKIMEELVSAYFFPALANGLTPAYISTIKYYLLMLSEHMNISEFKIFINNIELLLAFIKKIEQETDFILP